MAEQLETQRLIDTGAQQLQEERVAAGGPQELPPEEGMMEWKLKN